MKLVAYSKEYTSEFSLKNVTTLTPSVKAMILDKLNKNRSAGLPEYTRLVCLDGKHLCQYCGRITKGEYEDLLCDRCKETFGHSLYSEL